MIEINATLFTLLMEGFAFACALLLIGTIVSARRKGKDRKALRALVADINDEAAERLERAKALFPEGESAKTLSRHERGVCQAFIGAYNRRAADSVTGIYAALKTLVDAYQQELQQLQESQTAAPPAAEDDDKPTPKDAVISQLKDDYEQTTRELEITKRTMDKMLREYSSMFAGGSGAEDADELDAAEILKQMEGDEDAVDESAAGGDSTTDDTTPDDPAVADEGAAVDDVVAGDNEGADDEGAARDESAVDELAAALDIAVGEATAASDARSVEDSAAAAVVTIAEDDEVAAEPEAVLEFAEEDTDEESRTSSAA